MRKEKMMKKRMHDPELAHDVVINILTRLPVKTLLMFKIVCSLWRKTIECPHFVKLHASSYCRSHESEEKFLMIDSASNLCVVDVNTLCKHKIELEFELTPEQRRLNVYSSNGVLLLVDRRHARMVLWNPATGKYKDIPYPPDSNSHYYTCCFCGFWYDPCNEFRILIIRRLRQVLVFDSNSNSWKVVDTHLCNIYVRSTQLDSKAFIHGGFHLVASDTHKKQYRILSFSPEGKVIRDFQPPSDWNKLWKDVLKQHWFFLTTKVWEGRLCLQALASILDPQASSYYEYWNMEEYGNHKSWKKVCSLINPAYYLHSLQQNGRQLWVKYSDRLNDIYVKDGDSDKVKSVTSSSSSMSYVGSYTYTPTLLRP